MPSQEGSIKSLARAKVGRGIFNSSYKQKILSSPKALKVLLDFLITHNTLV
nr:MAG TPA: hypothetical protein [Caudoviricetes sp.]